MGTEAAVADPDAVLVADHGGEAAVLDAVDGERHDADAVDRLDVRCVQVDARQGAEPSA